MTNEIGRVTWFTILLANFIRKLSHVRLLIVCHRL